MIAISSRRIAFRKPESHNGLSHGALADAKAPWRPVVREDERDRLLQAVEALVRNISAAHGGVSADPSLSAGSAGVAVMYAELERAGVNVGSGKAARVLDDAIGVMATRPLDASFYPGFTGIAWAAEVVGDLLEPDGEDVNEEIDRALLKVLARVDWEHAPYDLVFGLTGLGVYALERLPRPAAADALEYIVEQLSRVVREDERGTYWWTSPALLLPPRRAQYPNGGVDLGVAHGLGGVIAFLARVQAAGVGDVGRLLTKTVDWLLAQALDTDHGPTFSYYVAEGVEPAPARLAWCYGDPGIAVALLLAAHEAGKPAWAEAATRIALVAAERVSAASGVVDAGFCHGSGGLAHLFNRMYQATAEPRFFEASRFWLDQTLVRLNDQWDVHMARSEERPVMNGHGLLEGAAGVVLVLLAAVAPHEPAWDRMFLISTRG